MKHAPPRIPPGSYDFAFHDGVWWETRVRTGDEQYWGRVVSSFFHDGLKRFGEEMRVCVLQFEDIRQWINSEIAILMAYEKATREKEERSRK